MRVVHKLPSLALIVLLIALSLVPSVSQARTAQPAPAAPIKLQAVTFNPATGDLPDLPAALTSDGYAPGQAGTYILQFQGPVQEAWKDQVTALGVELLAYIPDFAFKVRMQPAQAALVRRLDSVAWVGLFQPAFKLSPELDLAGANLVRIRLEPGADTGQARAAIARSGAEILSQDSDLLVAAVDGPQLAAIAQVVDVAWIEDYVIKEKHNEYGAGVIVGANTAHASGYDGSTQIAAVSDTGLGDGTASGAHPDIPASRIVSIHNWPGVTNICFQNILDDGAIDVDSGHGTHTAVSVLGDGGANGEGKGTAPAASLVFQATENWATISNYCQLFGGWPANGYFLTGLPDDLRQMYQQAYDDGARIHSNSWGSAQAGVYTLDSANTDDFVWDNPDMTITFSAGNEGTDTNANGVVDNDSIGSPATAKNVITVGASENDRADNWPCDTNLSYTSYDAYQPSETCSSMGGQNLLGTWGQRYGNSFLAEPLFSDVTAGNQEQMASWSSRGPTDDGRIKPDVVAPGTWILSGFSGLYQEGYGDPVNPQNGLYQWDGWGMPLNEAYKYMGGTSMSNPIAAGAATVVRDYYQKAHSHSASAALVKATVINSAVDLLDENNDGADDNDFPIPNVHEGWGRVNLANATDNSHQYVDNSTGLGTGGSSSYPFNIATSGQPLKVTLVWSDYPSTEAAGQNLVNDLDLVVTAPGGAQYRGNVFSGGWSQTGGSADRVNNVENVYVQSAAAGSWTVQVSGFNVPQGPQPFALVVDGTFGQVDNPPIVNIVNPAQGNTVSGPVPVQIDATDDNDPAGSLAVEWNVDDGAWQTTAYNSSTGYYEASWDTTGVADGEHTINARAVDSGSNVGSDSNGVTVDNVNNPPVATFSYTCTALSCDFDASASSDSDGSILSYAWDFGDGNTGSGVTASHTYAADGTYTVILTVSDNDSATGSDTQDVTVSEASSSVHVGDLDASSATAPRGRWDATVTITVHDSNEGTVSGALVEGNWGDGASGGDSCTTDSSGQCSITKGNLKSNVSSVTFSVSNITSSAGAYASGDNHDPDGDSDGTTIVVNQPGSNTPPTVTITTPANSATFDSGANINFAGTASDAEDGDLTAALVWTSTIDGQIGTGGDFSAVLSDGLHEITAEATDSGGAAGNASVGITVGTATTVVMHVGDLDGSSVAAPRNRWDATVTITVHDASESLVAGATVSGSWSVGGGGSCTTDASGQCSIAKTNIKGNEASATFTVTGVTRNAGDTYNPGANDDPDGDSDGTSIEIARP